MEEVFVGNKRGSEYGVRLGWVCLLEEGLNGCIFFRVGFEG